MTNTTEDTTINPWATFEHGWTCSFGSDPATDAEPPVVTAHGYGATVEVWMGYGPESNNYYVVSVRDTDSPTMIPVAYVDGNTRQAVVLGFVGQLIDADGACEMFGGHPMGDTIAGWVAEDAPIAPVVAMIGGW